MNTLTTIPKSGPQDIKDVPFSTTSLESVLNHGTVAQFNDLVDRAKSRKADLETGQQETYRLGQFTGNKHRIGQLYAQRVPGVRRFSVDYAAHAYQTCINESGLKILAEVAEVVIVKELATPQEKPKKKPKAHRVVVDPQNLPPITDTTTDTTETNTKTEENNHDNNR